MSKPLVSILIPCHNAQNWLAETIESALSQTWQHQEIIIVDDGSTDESLAIAKQFQSPLVQVLTQKKRGASAARNCALREAQGEFIQYLDADDLLAPDKIERQIQRLKDSQDCIASGEWARFRHSIQDAVFKPEPVWTDMNPIDWLVCSWQGGGMMPIHSWLTPRSLVEQAGYWNETLSVNDDGEYFCRILLNSQQVLFCSGAKSYYRSGLHNSLSQQRSEIAWKSAWNACKLGSDRLLAIERSPRTQKACATQYQQFIYSAYPDAIEYVHQAEVEVKLLGGSDLKIGGGLLFRLLCMMLGWKTAKHIQRAANRSHSLTSLYWFVKRTVLFNH